jgi:hypothetical protein
MRFCHLFELPRSAEAWSLAENGASLTVAMLERASGLPADLLFDMLRDCDLVRLAVVLRACGLEADAAARLLQGLAALASLRPDTLPPAADLRALGPEDAARLVAGWRNLYPLTHSGALW